jgi:hypothetical protein
MIDRLLDDLRAIVRETFPRLAYLGTYEYVVFEASAPTYNLKPTDPKAGLPALPDVRVKPGIPGLTSSMVVDALVYVVVRRTPTQREARSSSRSRVPVTMASRRRASLSTLVRFCSAAPAGACCGTAKRCASR